MKLTPSASAPSTTISLPADLRKALVHFSFLGLRFILNCSSDQHPVLCMASQLPGLSLKVQQAVLQRQGHTYILVAFRSAESKRFGIVSHERDPFLKSQCQF